MDKMVSNKVFKIYFMLDSSRGLQFIYFKKLAHCDMKPANILVDQDSKGRLFRAPADFGISQMFSENAQLVQAFKVVNVRGASVAYAAPEVATRLRTRVDATKELAFAGDIYSLGMISFALLNTTDGW